MRFAILGTGLIGASIARACKAAGTSDRIAAYDPQADALAYAKTEGFIDIACDQPQEAVKGADLVLLTAPPAALPELAAAIAPALKPGAIVTDVASVKSWVLEHIPPLLPPHVTFVPSHPIAGKETHGAKAAEATLFQEKRVILTPQRDRLQRPEVQRVRIFWQKLGAQAEFMPAEMHDCIYAVLSHLPQWVAFAAASCDLPSSPHPACRSFLRLQQSNPLLWEQIFTFNAPYLQQALAHFSGFLTQMTGELQTQPPASVAPETDLTLLFAALVGSCLVASAGLLESSLEVPLMRYAGTGFADMTAACQAIPAETLLEQVSAQNFRLLPLLERFLVALNPRQLEAMAGKNSFSA